MSSGKRRVIYYIHLSLSIMENPIHLSTLLSAHFTALKALAFCRAPCGAFQNPRALRCPTSIGAGLRPCCTLLSWWELEGPRRFGENKITPANLPEELNDRDEQHRSFPCSIGEADATFTRCVILYDIMICLVHRIE